MTLLRFSRAALKKAGLTDNQIRKIVEDLKSFIQKYPDFSMGAINLTMHVYTSHLGTFREKRMLAKEALRALIRKRGDWVMSPL